MRYKSLTSGKFVSEYWAKRHPKIAIPVPDERIRGAELVRSVSFTVPGLVPSKSNYRFTPGKRGREKWARIKQYEQEIALSAIAAGGKPTSAKGKATVKVLLVNQKCDIDNALKVAIDGLKRVLIPDDSPEYLRAIQVAWEGDEGGPRAEYRVEWEDE